MQLPISSNKFIPPQLAPDAVPRTGILDFLAAQQGNTKVMVFQAPAGYGKTTAMLQYYQKVRQEGAGVAWITLDEADNDIVRYVHCLSRAVKEFCPDTQRPADPDSSPIAQLLRLIDEVQGPLYVFLDEFEAIRDPSLVELLSRGIAQLPPDKHVVIGSRDVPELPLTRLLVSGEAIVLGPEQLRFGDGETATFVERRWGEGLSADGRTALYQATEGWPAAMQICAMAFGHARVPAEQLPATLKKSALVSNYVMENVMRTLPADVSDFLLKTCCLRRLSAPLCNALTGLQNSQQMLSQLADKGVFIQPIDDEHEWFVLHALFADLLRQESQRTRPGEYEEMCRRAAVWLEANGRPESAIDYAITAGDREFAGRIMEQNVAALLFDARLETIQRWVRLLGETNLGRAPELQFAAGWAAIFSHDFETADARIGALAEINEQQRSRLATSRALEVMQAANLVFQDRMDERAPFAPALLDELDELHPFNRLSAVNIQGVYLLAQGETLACSHWLKRMYHHRLQSRNLFSAVYYDTFSALTLMVQGQLDGAQQMLDDAPRLAGVDPSSRSVPSAVIAPLRAVILYEQNRIEAAMDLLEEQLPVVRQYDALDWLVMGYTTLTRCLAAQGMSGKAWSLLDELERCAYANNWPRMVRIARWEQIRLHTLGGKLDAAAEIRRSLELEGLAQDKQPALFPSEIEHTDIGAFRLLIHQGQVQGLDERLQHEIAVAVKRHRHYRALKLRLVQCLLLEKSDNATDAVEALRSCVREFVPLGFVRSFIDEGSTMLELLRRVGAAGGRETPLVRKLLDACNPMDSAQAAAAEEAPRPAPPPADKKPSPLLEPLTDRELEILAQVAAGASNRDIANGLFLSESTIKWHLGNIYGKLGVKQRTQAIAQARALGLLG